MHYQLNTPRTTPRPHQPKEHLPTGSDLTFEMGSAPQNTLEQSQHQTCSLSWTNQPRNHLSLNPNNPPALAKWLWADTASYSSKET